MSVYVHVSDFNTHDKECPCLFETMQCSSDFILPLSVRPSLLLWHERLMDIYFSYLYRHHHLDNCVTLCDAHNAVSTDTNALLTTYHSISSNLSLSSSRHIHYNPSLIPHIHLRHLIFPRSYSDSARDCTHPSGLTSLTFPFAYPLSFLSLPFISHRLFFPSSLLLLSTLLAFPNRSRFILRNVVAKKIEEESGATDEQCIEGLGWQEMREGRGGKWRGGRDNLDLLFTSLILLIQINQDYITLNQTKPIDPCVTVQCSTVQYSDLP